MNKEFKEKLDKLMKSLNLQYNNYDLYEEAFTHKTYANEHKSENLNDYQRLEFLGDAILDFLVAEYLYENENDPEGAMTKIRAEYVCESANASYTKELGLIDLVRIGKGLLKDGMSDKIISDFFESFLGALYLDHDICYVRDFLKGFLFPKLVLKNDDYLVDYKSQLQEYFQADTRITVTYKLLSEKGPAHNREFESAVYHEGLLLGTGTGKSKKISEMIAAKDALDKLAGKDR